MLSGEGEKRLFEEIKLDKKLLSLFIKNKNKIIKYLLSVFYLGNKILMIYKSYFLFMMFLF
jgi:hypothetical protein